MLDIHSLLKNLKRPTLLVRAARFGVDDYNRSSDLPRLLGTINALGPSEAILRLLDLESELNDERVSNAPNYSLPRHIETLTAIMAEQRFLSSSQS